MAFGAVHLGDRCFGRGPAAHGRHVVQRQFAIRGAGGDGQVDVARALFFEGLVERWQRLDADAVPAGVVERLGDRVLDRVVGADVDVVAVLDVP
jgi:hypothetical protein